ncbi:MAG: chemotaxis protein chel [Magnetospirillum sp.]|nr:MAG: chemotaxis protein chel [Magnetospirillum sp.]
MAMSVTPAFDPSQSAPKPPPMHATSEAAAAKVGKQFEAQFVSQMFQHMFEGVKTDGIFGGGSGEEMFRSLLIDEYGKMVANRGGISGTGSGFGIGAAVQKMLLKHQEVQ